MLPADIPSFSFFWTDPQSRMVWEERPDPLNHFIKDLGIEKVLETLFPNEQIRWAIEKLFYKPCSDENTLKYRLNIMEDFVRNEELCIAFDEFSRRVADIDKLCKPMFKNEEDIHKSASWFNAVRKYIDAFTDLKNFLMSSSVQAKSEGLIRFQELLVSIMNTDSFCEMNDFTNSLLAGYKDVSEIDLAFNYNMVNSESAFNVDEKLSDVTFMQHKSNYNDDEADSLISSIIHLSAPFSSSTKSRYARIYDGSCITRLDQIVLDRLMKDNPGFFDRLNSFFKKYCEYPVQHFSLCRPEINFYVTFAALTRNMMKAGISFCKPRVLGRDRREIKVEKGVDLSLALQLCESNNYSDISDQIVANDYSFDDEGRVFVLTGPNQGGKTTFIHSIGLIQAMFQAGCMIPAKSAAISPVDAIYTHFPEEEVLGIKKGRLGEEAERISLIMSNATKNSLILLNETFSSTRRIDGYNLGRDLIRSMMKASCLSIFVTHINELAYDIDAFNGELPDGSTAGSLMASVVDIDGSGLSGKRTYRIIRQKPSGFAYSRDIVLKHRLTSEHLLQLLKERGYLSEDGGEAHV